MLRFLSTIWHWFLPSRCVLCKTPGPYCCSRCVDGWPPAWDLTDHTIALYDYSHPAVKRAIWILKYRGIKSLAPIFGSLLADRLIEELADFQNLHPGLTLPWLIVPIPLTRRRERKRGFNQSALIAKALAASQPELFALVANVLVKIKETPPQASLANRARRLNNVKGVFRLTKPELVRHRAVIILDDVMTTGSTLREAERVLRTAEPRTIWKVAVAHG